MLGQRVIDLWGAALHGQEGAIALQIKARDDIEAKALLQRFRAWYDWTVDLPGAYYHQTVLWLFKENRLAEGRFVALGRRIDLNEVRHPIFLLAARDDELVAPGQLMAVRRLVGTECRNIESIVEPCGHLGLFVGAASLEKGWSRAARWLAQSFSPEV